MANQLEMALTYPPGEELSDPGGSKGHPRKANRLPSMKNCHPSRCCARCLEPWAGLSRKQRSRVPCDELISRDERVWYSYHLLARTTYRQIKRLEMQGRAIGRKRGNKNLHSLTASKPLHEKSELKPCTQRFMPRQCSMPEPIARLVLCIY